MSRNGHDKILGLTHSDHDPVAFLEAAGVIDPEKLIDDPRWLEWRGAAAPMGGRGCLIAFGRGVRGSAGECLVAWRPKLKRDGGRR